MEFELKDFELMGANVKDKLKFCGEGVRLHPLSKIGNPGVVELLDRCRICDFAFLWGGHGIKIGKHTDIQPHVVVWGGGELIIGDCVSVAVGTVLLTAVYDYKGGLKMVDGLPEGQTHALYGKLVIENDVYVGANCTLMPDIVIGEGAILGAGSFINKNIEPWSINVGSPSKKIGERPRLVV
jgi:acetyltransferase-like isoleucine patch superfamily enzyme